MVAQHVHGGAATPQNRAPGQDETSDTTPHSCPFGYTSCHSSRQMRYWEKTRDDDVLLGHINLSVRLDPHDLSSSNKDAKGSVTSCQFQACSSLTLVCHMGSHAVTPVLRSLGSTYFLVIQLSCLPSVWLNSLPTCLHSLTCLCPFSKVRFKLEHRSPNYSLPRKRKNFPGYRSHTLKAGEAFIRLLILLHSSSFSTVLVPSF